MNNFYEQILNGFISISEVKKTDVIMIIYKEEIIVRPQHVITMLQKCLEEKVTTQELSKWSSFLLFNDIYISPDWEDDKKCDNYESMWYVLQQLSSPYIDGEITDDKIIEHISQLKRIEK